MSQPPDWVEALWRELRPQTVARVWRLNETVALLSEASEGPVRDTVDHALVEAHQLSGSLGSFGLIGASELAHCLEQLLVSSQFERAAETALALANLVDGFSPAETQGRLRPPGPRTSHP